MAMPRKLPVPFLLLFVAAAFLAAVAPAPAQAAPQEYCANSLAGLTECQSFMYGGAAEPSSACCAAYEGAFDANPFCLCYVADGMYGRATGFDVDVDYALQIPAHCGQAQPPIELCSMQGLVLPPYDAPQGALAQPPAAAAPAPEPTAGAGPSGPPPSLTPPPPPPTSNAKLDSLPKLLVLLAGVVVAGSIL